MDESKPRTIIYTHDRTDSLTHWLAERELTLPFLCFFASHRPLAFIVSQALYLVEPLAMLFGNRLCGEWAALLCDGEALNQFEAALTNSETLPRNPTNSQR